MKKRLKITDVYTSKNFEDTLEKVKKIKDINRLSESELLTGNKIQATPKYVPSEGDNVEVENKEQIKHPDGEVQEVYGRTHAQGGEKMYLDEGTRVLSEKLKLGPEGSKVVNEAYGLGTKSTNSFASVISKYNKKSGLDELNEKQRSLFEKLKKNEEVDNEATSQINKQYLSDKINTIEEQKRDLELPKSSIFDLVYDIQQKKKGINPQNQEGISSFSEGGEVDTLADAFELTPEQKEEFKNQLRLLSKSEGLSFNSVITLAKRLSVFKDTKLPETEEEFLKSPMFRNTVKNKNAVLSLIKKYDPTSYIEYERKAAEGAKTSEAEKVADKNPNNTSKTLADNNYDLSKFKRETSKYKFLDSPVYRDNKFYSQGLTDSGIKGIQTAGTINKDNVQTLFKHMYDSFPSMRNLFKTTTDARGNMQLEPKDPEKFALESQNFWDTQSKQVMEYAQKYGVTGDELENLKKGTAYYNYDEDGAPVTKKDGIIGNYFASKSGLQWDFVTDDQLKKINDLGIVFARDAFKENGDLKDELVNIITPEQAKSMKESTNYSNLDLKIGSHAETPVVTSNEEAVKVDKKPIQSPNPRPILPDMSVHYPSAPESHALPRIDLSRISPRLTGYGDVVSQVSAGIQTGIDNLDGLTESGRSAMLSDISSKGFDSIANAVTQTNAANQDMGMKVDEYNATKSDAEAQARVNSVLDYEKKQMSAQNNSRADWEDFIQTNREIRIKKFNYLTQQKQINDLADHYKIGADGSIVFADGSYLPATVVQQNKLGIDPKTKTTTTINPTKVDATISTTVGDNKRKKQ